MLEAANAPDAPNNWTLKRAGIDLRRKRRLIRWKAVSGFLVRRLTCERNRRLLALAMHAMRLKDCSEMNRPFAQDGNYCMGANCNVTGDLENLAERRPVDYDES